MQIALDAMGGDQLPGQSSRALFRPSLPNRASSRTGWRSGLDRAAAGHDGGPRDRIEFFHCTQTISNGRDRRSWPCAKSRTTPSADAGNCWPNTKSAPSSARATPGPWSRAGLRLRRFLKNVSGRASPRSCRPCAGRACCIDVGRQHQPQAGAPFSIRRHGEHFRSRILNREHPTIGLMNVGSEEQKGHDLAKETHALFNASPFRDQFIGNIEGRDIHRGACDVVVTDGFVGNVVLKVCEGVFEFVMKMAARKSWLP